jgi:predicted permease
MLNDLRYALRMLLHAKGWTTVVILSLALGIGANTAIFSAVNAMLLRTIPVAEPDTLVRLRFVGRNQMSTSSSDYGYSRPVVAGENARSTFSYPMYQQFLKDNQTLTDLFACAPAGRVNVVVDGQAELATAFLSTGNFYRILGVNARVGRAIVPDDDRADAPPVAVISDRFWRARFGADPATVGKVVGVNNLSVTIVGVLPAEFTGVQQPIAEPPDIAFPLALESSVSVVLQAKPRLPQPTVWWLQVMGRLRPGVTPAQVEGNLGGVFQATAKAGLDSYLAGLSESARALSSNQGRTAVPRLLVQPGGQGVYDVNQTELRGATVLTVVVALVLLIVCANVANLLLSRATSRHKEISVRLSMGATRRRLIGQLLVESLLLASIGGALGVAVGYWGKLLLPSPVAQNAPLDWRVLVFVTFVTALTGVLFGIAPALRATAGDVSGVLKETSRSVVASRSFLSKSLLVVQVAVSLVLLMAAGVFLRTLDNLRHVDVGFDPTNLVLFRISPELNRYDEQRTAWLYQQIIDGVSAIAGVRGVALSNPTLLSGSTSSTSIYVQGRPPVAPELNSINRLIVSPNFFQVMGMPMLLGRGFSDAENNANAPKVAVINETAMRMFFGNENPIGQRFGGNPESTNQIEVVGVLRDAKYATIREEVPPTAYIPHLQTRLLGPTIGVRTVVDPLSVVGSIRETLRAIDPNVPMTDVSTQMEQIERRLVQERTFAQAYSLFGALSLVLAAIGLFGLMSYSVARRTSEIGIRMALGAQRTQVLGATMRESLVLVGLGLLIGTAVAIGAGGLVENLLFGVAAQDVWTMASAMTLMALCAALAAYLPARRASRIDPMVALRYE